MRARPSYGLVRTALEELSATKKPDLFVTYFSAKTVSEKAGVAESTAKKYLDELTAYRGYRRSRVNGTIGYRYDEPGVY